MVEQSASNQRKKRVASDGPWARIELFVTIGLAALITSVFTLGSDILKGRQSRYEQQCAIAQQIVLDDSASPALSEAQRERLSVSALRRVERCIGERT
jgi:hypothetical protein